MRVISLLPSATEIVYALGIEPVGVSHECDYPPEAAERPSVNRCLIDPDASSTDINEQLEETVDEHGSVYEIKLDTLRELDPDLIVTQGVCDVCAVDRVLVEEAVTELDLDARVLTTDPHSLEDVLRDVIRIGKATDRKDRAEEVVADLRERIRAVEETAATTDATPRVAVLDWMEPPMVSGHWIPTMVERAGGRYELTDPGVHSTPEDWADIVAYDPEVLAVAPCGFDLEQTAEHLHELSDREGWRDLSAVESGRVYAVDGHQFVNRPGPRLVETLEFLGEMIHSEEFDFLPADGVERLATKPA